MTCCRASKTLILLSLCPESFPIGTPSISILEPLCHDVVNSELVSLPNNFVVMALDGFSGSLGSPSWLSRGYGRFKGSFTVEQLCLLVVLIGSGLVMALALQP